MSGRQAACRRRQTEENQANVAAADVNTEETHENDKRKYQMVVQLYMGWLILMIIIASGGSSSSICCCSSSSNNKKVFAREKTQQHNKARAL